MATFGSADVIAASRTFSEQYYAFWVDVHTFEARAAQGGDTAAARQSMDERRNRAREALFRVQEIVSTELAGL
jgi:hypothetical protein